MGGICDTAIGMTKPDFSPSYSWMVCSARSPRKQRQLTLAQMRTLKSLLILYMRHAGLPVQAASSNKDRKIQPTAQCSMQDNIGSEAEIDNSPRTCTKDETCNFAEVEVGEGPVCSKAAHETRCTRHGTGHGF